MLPSFDSSPQPSHFPPADLPCSDTGAPGRAQLKCSQGSWKSQDLPLCLGKQDKALLLMVSISGKILQAEELSVRWANPESEFTGRSSVGSPSQEFCREGNFSPFLSVVSKLQEEMWELAQPPGRTQACVNHWISPHQSPAPHRFPVPARAEFQQDLWNSRGHGMIQTWMWLC